MNINDLRKLIFVNSQYCNWYNVGNNTVLAGIIRNDGYLYKEKLSDAQIQIVDKEYRKYTTIMNCIVGLEIILFIYCVIFPYFIGFMQQPFFVSILVLTLIPLLALLLTYIVVNKLFENKLFSILGEGKKTVFRPSYKNINEKAFQKYLSTPRKSIFVLLLMAVLFLGYVLTPFTVASLNSAKRYKNVISLANLYLKLVPISSEVYAYRAYAKYNLKQYKDAVLDYEAANKYSLSSTFNSDIVGVKTFYLPYKEMLVEFDKAINVEDVEAARYLLRYEKAVYQLRHNEYKSAFNELNNLVNAYSQNKQVFFSPALAYFNRGIAREALGDINGANADKAVARKMCQECTFNQDVTIIHKP